MDIPSLMVAAAQESGNFIAQSIKMAKVSEKEKKELINVELCLNCDNNEISFDYFAYYRESSEKDYNYFGNNQSAATQIYAVREVNNLLSYWFCRMKGILMNVLEFLPEGSLKDQLEICRQQGLFDENGLNIKYMSGIAAETVIKKKEKEILLAGEKVSAEKWLIQVLGLTSKQKPILIVPVIIQDGEKIVISQHPDYIGAIENFLGNSSDDKRGKEMKVCHICGELTDTIDTKTFSGKLDRYSISKVFVTTPINYAPQFDKKMHQKNFAICKSCYEKWYSAEKVIMKDYQIKIAGENAIVLTEGIGKKLDREDLSSITRKIDIAFNPNKYETWLDELKEDYFEEQEIELFEFNLEIFTTDGKSCSIKKSIEDVSSVWFYHVQEVFKKKRIEEDFAERLRRFTLGSIYAMIPVQTNKKGEQLNVTRILELYAAILQRNFVDSKVLFEYFAETTEIGYREIRAKEVRDFKNLYRIEYFQKEVRKNGSMKGFEWYVSHMCYAYLALIEILKELKVIKSEVMTMTDNLENAESKDSVQEKEAFLVRHGFSNHAKGVFYVGAMMYQVGVMQYYQDHKNKPILEKVTYSGMSDNDIVALLAELHDKIKQYRAAMNNLKKGHLVYYAERYAERAYVYLGNLPIQRQQVRDEHENLFYLMSGYSSCISNNKGKNEEEENDNEA